MYLMYICEETLSLAIPLSRSKLPFTQAGEMICAKHARNNLAQRTVQTRVGNKYRKQERKKTISQTNLQKLSLITEIDGGDMCIPESQ